MSLDIRKRRSVALAAGATVAIFAGYGTGAVAEGAVAILAGVLTAALVSRTTAIGPRHATVARTKAVFGVASDPRYLTTIGGTRGEMIQPVFDEAGAVVGTIDVE